MQTETKLTSDEINKIIAEYMGVHLEAFLTYNYKVYTKSTDQCLPVIERLQEHYLKANPQTLRFNISVTHGKTSILVQLGKAVLIPKIVETRTDRALATALAAAIKELE